jgi:membrane-associated phospholipid phosphatase
MNAGTARWRATCLVALAAFLGLAAAVYTTGLLPGDALVRHEVLRGRGTLVHAIAHWTNYGGTWVVLLPAMALLLAFSQAARRRWYLWSGVFVAAGVLELLFKVLVARPRPRGVHWGFPSGHVTAAATFGVLLIYLVSRERLTPAARRAFQGLAVMLVVAVGFARVILNTHWPADVLGGLLLGAGCAAAGAWWDASRLDLNPVGDAR